LEKKVLILAGGGGHTSIALALAQSLQGKTHLSFLIPENDQLSRSLLSPYGEVDELTKGRYPHSSNYLLPLRFLISTSQSLSKISRGHDLVVSTGSNFCIPPAFIAFMKSIPLVNIESRVAITKPSKTARLLEPFSRWTILQWEEQSKNLRGTVVGPIFPQKRFETKDAGFILVTGGTEGHKPLFDAVVKLDLNRVVMQTGKVPSETYRRLKPEWEFISYSTEFEKLIAESSLVITHQGGGTIFEAVLYEKPLIIVFNPELTRTANTEDMKLLARKVNAPFLDLPDPNKIMDLIQKSSSEKTPQFKNGRENLSQIILQALSNN
jgi:UDP-N-acetylglucosamine--N-acetylmuramyl-(pentapeptide) pyrophosphoryl-undecaprenol N-acetylglucosamine transferase